MNENHLSPEDPRLTLYALGGMEPSERAGFEQLLAQDAAARQIVEDIRATAGVLTAALEHEPMAAPDAKPAGKVLRFPQAYFMISGLAAACFAVFFVLWQNEHALKKQTQIIAVQLPAAKDDNRLAEAVPGAEMAAAPAPTAMATESQVPDLLPVAGAAPQVAELLEDHAARRQKAEVLADYTSMGGLKKETDFRNLKLEAKAKMAAPSARPGEAVQLQTFAVEEGKGRGNYIGGAPYGGPVVLGATVSADRLANTESYGYSNDNVFLRVADEPLSTFSIDVDTASYANVRRFVTQKVRPPVSAVRIEELVNYFPYDYRPPTGEVPFAASLEVAAAPWASGHRLVRVGLKGREVSDAQRPSANLVFLLDVSGSMRQANKLPLVKQSLRLLVEKLRPDDRVAIAVYAGASGLALPSTPVSRKGEIMEAIEWLDAGGSTNGAMGIHLAYDIAKANFIAGGVNRVILATDGDFNVGPTSEGELVRLIEDKAKSGVFLSVLGFGMGNLKDSTLEQLADKGNGNYAYIDTLAEARKTLVEQVGGTLMTIAKDVKIQVEFNPARVQAYRLIGYENRLLAKEDFNNDKVDAGEIGAGHTVTALYEVVPAGVDIAQTVPAVDGLKYQAVAKIQTGSAQELLTVKVRYKEPAGDVSSKLEFPLVDTGAGFADASPDFKFAAAVAGFGMVLRDSPHKNGLTLAQVADWGRAGLGQDSRGYRAEFLTLVGEAEGLLR